MNDFKIDIQLKQSLKEGVVSPVKSQQEVINATEKNLKNKEIYGALKKLSTE
ncbi:hypothetical protein ITQ84_07200 [Pediococcus pentosaceus]|uniref:hypothetical protein n=1 Tax=Pediococcus pentosaceus TaxID=1255 RepID=UPI001330A5C4|nr:hypothetical protein [Pediococcus pentosaceus]MBF7140164.1 hypothetical protein [Pediococcus pentosaceus]MCM6819726.1 hypothetical protein [Pediococcus pentosaceus]